MCPKRAVSCNGVEPMSLEVLTSAPASIRICIPSSFNWKSEGDSNLHNLYTSVECCSVQWCPIRGVESIDVCPSVDEHLPHVVLEMTFDKKRDFDLNNLDAPMMSRSVKRCPTLAGECIHVRPMMKQNLLARPLDMDLIRVHLVYLCDLDATVDSRRVQSGFSIEISDINSCFVLYQYLQTTIRKRQV